MLGNKSSMLILMLRMKLPGNESSIYETFVLGNKSSRTKVLGHDSSRNPHNHPKKEPKALPKLTQLHSYNSTEPLDS